MRFFYEYAYKTRTERVERGCEFFRSPNNELLLRKAVYGTPILQKEEERKKEKRTNKIGRKRETQFIRIIENIAPLGMAIRKYSKSKVVKEDYQLSEIKIGLFIIPRSEPRRNKHAAVHRILIKYNKDKRTEYSLKLSSGSKLAGSSSINYFFFF